MGHTALGVAPPKANPRTDVPPSDIPEPFAAVPATLAGLNAVPAFPVAPAASMEVDSAAATQKGAPDTLAGIAATAMDATTQSSINPSQTLRGFTRDGQVRDGANRPSLVGADPSSTMPSQGAAAAPIPAAGKLGAPSDEIRANAAPGEDLSPHALAHSKSSSSSTLLGVSPLYTPPSPTTGVAAGNATLDGLPSVSDKASSTAGNATLLGVSPLASGPEQKPPDLKRTILGIAAAPIPNRSAGNSTLIMEATASNQAPVDPHRTMLGVAPMPAATPVKVADADAFAADNAHDRHKGTLLGVAMPGIAPLQPGHAKVVLASPPPPPFGAVLGNGSDPSKPRALSAPAPADASTAQRRLAWVFGLAAALMVVVGAGAVYLWWTAAHLTVQVTSNESGAEQLTLSCSNCPNGTIASIESSSAQFKNAKATIDLKRRLTVGVNRLSLKVKRPNRATSETVSVTVPIEFRVTTSLAELVADPPAISVQLEAAPKTKFVIDGRHHAVGLEGKLTVPIDVSKSLTGAASAVVPFEQRLAYEIDRSGTPTKGTLVVRTGVTALELFTPGATHITQNPTFTVTGRTSPRAKLTANSHPIAVAPDGTFHQEMALSAPGSTRLVVRAQEPQLAPRLVEITLERVTNLKQRADELAQPLPTDFDSVFALASEKPDSLVALRGEVIASESANALTRIAATASCKRTPCLFSVRYGGPLSLPNGTRILTIGKARLTTRTNNPAENDLSIDASLVVEAPSR